MPAARAAHVGKCGACRAALPPPAEPIEVGERDFDELTRGAPVPILIDFWAPWCGPCRMAAPEVARTAKDLAGSALVLKVNTDQQPALAQRFEVRGIPMFVVMKGGRVVKQETGVRPAAVMEDWLRAA